MTRSDFDELTVCDRCSQSMHCDDTTIPQSGRWADKELCPYCAEKIRREAASELDD